MQMKATKLTRVTMKTKTKVEDGRRTAKHIDDGDVHGINRYPHDAQRELHQSCYMKIDVWLKVHMMVYMH